jgi:hypothetical protein
MKLIIYRREQGNKDNMTWWQKKHPIVWRPIETWTPPMHIRTEEQVIKYVRDNHGEGFFRINVSKKGMEGFRGIFYGDITRDSWIREKGRMQLFFDAEQHGVRHRFSEDE